MKYFVKSHFYGWKEVRKDNYDRFVKNIIDNATGLSEQKKTRYIEKVTRKQEENVRK